MPFTVKWNKKSLALESLPVTSDELKAILAKQTGVPEDRLSLMCKQAWKGVLANGVELSQLNVPLDALIVMMGTPTTAVSDAPKDKVVFLEDLSSSAQAATGKVLPPGLNNLGNTCYLNSTIQVLRVAPELSRALASAAVQQNNVDPGSKLLAKELSGLFTDMNKFVDKVTPIRFVTTVRQVFSRFNEQTPRGGYVQQVGMIFFKYEN